jgi:hypothetical protein
MLQQKGFEMGKTMHLFRIFGPQERDKGLGLK